MVKLNKVRGSVDLSDWTLPAIDDFTERIDRTLMKACEQACALLLDNAFVCLAALSHPEQETDPLAVYILLDDSDADVMFKFDLRERLREDIQECKNDSSRVDVLQRVREAMLELVSEIDAVLPSK